MSARAVVAPHPRSSKGCFVRTEEGREGANEPKKVDGRRGASERARGGGRAPGGRSRAVVAAGKRGD